MYRGKKRHEVPPHIYAITDTAYRSMLQGTVSSLFVIAVPLSVLLIVKLVHPYELDRRKQLDKAVNKYQQSTFVIRTRRKTLQVLVIKSCLLGRFNLVNHLLLFRWSC